MRLAVWALTAALAGCAAPGVDAPQPNAEALSSLGAAAPPAAGAASAPAIWIDVRAPQALKELLERNLDLSRLAGTTLEEGVGATELQRLVAAAPAQARALLSTEGFFSPEITATREPSAADGQVRVRVEVAPGARAHIERVTLVTQGDLGRDYIAQTASSVELVADLNKNWLLPVGEPFRNPRWAEAKAALMARLRAQGYASAAISGSNANVDMNDNRVRLQVVVDSGPLYRAGALLVEGVQLHDQATVRDLAGFGAGTPLTEVVLLDYQERLLKAGLFDSATVTFEPNPERAATAPVLVSVHELPRNQATVGVGYSANTGQRVSVEHTDRRVLGRALTSHNKVELGRDRQAWEGELSTHPGKGFYRNLLGGQVERLQTSIDNVLTQRLRLGRTQDTQRIERLYFAEFDRSRQTAAGVDRDAQALSANYHLILRRLDSVVLPTRGVLLSLQGAAGQARSNYSDSGPFTRAYARLTGYLPLGANWFSEGRVEAGQIFKRDAVALPDTLAFRAGGDGSVRGYAYRTLAPTVNGVVSGGNVLATASVEVAHPLLERLPSMWGALFFDTGNAALSWRDFKAVRGYGVGLRWRSPVGPLRIDWAYGEELRRARLHLSVGIAF